MKRTRIQLPTRKAKPKKVIEHYLHGKQKKGFGKKVFLVLSMPIKITLTVFLKAHLFKSCITLLLLCLTPFPSCITKQQAL